MKKIILLFVIVAIATTVNAQDFNLAAGLRGGLANGISVKKTIGEPKAIELILNAYSGGFVGHGLMEFYNPAFSVDGLNWFYGFGGHVGLWSGSKNPWSDSNSLTIVGIDGIVGLEYKFSKIPLHVGIDYKPAFNFVGYTGFWADGGGLSVRYIIK